MGFHEAAIGRFRRAYELHKEAGSGCAAAACLRRAAETGLLMSEPNFELAAKGFEEVGRLMITNEITAFGADSNFANSIYCLLASGMGSTAKQKLEEFVKLDSHFATSVEGVGARVLLETFSGGNRNQTRDRVEGLREVCVMPSWRSALLDKVVDRL
jgi:hypothetical protein